MIDDKSGLDNLKILPPVCTRCWQDQRKQVDATHFAFVEQDASSAGIRFNRMLDWAAVCTACAFTFGRGHSAYTLVLVL